MPKTVKKVLQNAGKTANLNKNLDNYFTNGRLLYIIY